MLYTEKRQPVTLEKLAGLPLPRTPKGRTRKVLLADPSDNPGGAVYAPIYHQPAAQPSPEVLAYEREILAAEGPYHVEGHYYANHFDAERQRRWTAERTVREAQRRADYVAPNATATPAARPRVSTWLTPRERQRVDAAAGEHFASIHRDTLAGVRADLTLAQADAALVSAALVGPSDVPALTSLVRGLPACTVVGLVTDTDDARALAAALLLGHAGVPQLLDGRAPSGWQTLRGAFGSGRLPRSFQRDALAAILSDLGTPDASAAELTAGCMRFFRAIFSPRVATAKVLAADLGVCSSTLMSRFYRAGLPSPKRYIATARLAWAAHLAESPALSVAAIALRLDASSPQSFGRTVRTMTGLTAGQFREAYTGAAMLDRFRATLVAPFRDTLRTFDPLTEQPATHVRPRAQTSTQVSTLATGRAA